MFNLSKFFFGFVVLFLAGCSDKQKQPLFELMEKTGIDFTNQVEDGKKENSLDLYFPLKYLE